MDISVEWFQHKRVTVMGLGVHGGGLGTAIWLMRRGAQVTVTDLKDQTALAASIADLERAYYRELQKYGKQRIHKVRYVLGRHDESDFSDADLVIQNPAVPRDNPLLALARANGVPIETDISIFFRLCPFPIVGITGTKGKTTVTTLLAAIARAHDPKTVVCGNIRIAPLAQLDALLRIPKRRAAPPVIMELSSWQLEGLAALRKSPHISIVTNVMPDHLNRYDGMADYARAKELIVANQGANDVCILNADNEWTRGMASRAKSRVLWFGKKISRAQDGCYIKEACVMYRRGGKEKKLFAASTISVIGEHARMNVLAAVAGAMQLGIPKPTITAAVRAFKGAPGRLETIGSARGVTFVNDTTATMPDASIAALKALGAASTKKRIILISGGADKQLEFGEWAKEVKRRVKAITLFDGTATAKIERALDGARYSAPRIGARSMREAVDAAMERAERGDIILLSPGCASFGVFLHEFDRGDKFAAEVRRVAVPGTKRTVRARARK